MYKEPKRLYHLCGPPKIDTINLLRVNACAETQRYERPCHLSNGNVSQGLLSQVKSEIYLPIVFFTLAFLSGCSSYQHRDQMSSFNSAYISGDYQAALSVSAIDLDKGEEINPEAHLLELLHQGEAFRLNGQYEQSIQAFDLAENGMKYLDTESMLEKLGEGFMATVINDSETDYEALMCEAVLVNTYKGLSFLASGNNEYARVEFNRADDRTRRAVEYFHEKIEEQTQALAKEARNKNSTASLVKNSLNNDDLDFALNKNYGDVSSWSAYPEFIVPASTYLHGLYFLANAQTSSDFDRAETSLKRVSEMTPDNNALAKDAELAKNLAKGKAHLADLGAQVWIVYENGLGPILQESRFDIPLFLFHDSSTSPIYFGIALPKYVDRPAVPGNIKVIFNSDEIITTEEFSYMGAAVRTEMKERFPGVLSRAVASAVIKASIQNEAAKQFGALGRLGAAALTVSTTQADLRGWQAMPNHWQTARIDRPTDGRLSLVDAQGDELGTVAIPNQKFTLVYIKQPTATTPATVITLDLQGSSKAITKKLVPKPQIAGLYPK